MKTKVIKSVEVSGKVWTKDSLKELLRTNDEAVIRGMKRIHEYQTSDEQVTEETKYRNDVGFSGCDAKLLSSFVEKHNKFGSLSDKQMFYARKKMVKYAGQLLLIMAGQLPKP